MLLQVVWIVIILRKVHNDPNETFPTLLMYAKKIEKDPET